MKKMISFLVFVITIPSYGQHLDIGKLCTNAITSTAAASDKHSYAFIKETKGGFQLYDHGICTKIQNNLKLGSYNYEEHSYSKPEKKSKWKLKLYASQAFTKYYNTDITIKSSRYNVLVKDYEWVERGSRNFFSPKTWLIEGNNPLQIFDEPSNTYMLSFESDKMSFFVSAFHPKFSHNSEQVKHITGTIDGVAVDHIAPINKPFDGYNQEDGEMELVRNEFTYSMMEYEVGAFRKITLFNNNKFGKFTISPGVSAGIMSGPTLSVIVQEGEWWDFDDYKSESRFDLIGVGGSLRLKVQYELPNERFGIFVENKHAIYKVNAPILDGNQTFIHRYNALNVGFSFKIHQQKMKKKKNEFN